MKKEEQMKHVMIDLETLDTAATAAIVAIGAVFFDPDHNELGDTFYRAIDVSSVLGHGFSVSGDTLKWWLQQSDEARQVFANGNEIGTVLDELAVFLESQGKTESVKVWGNGAAFDNVILANAFSATKRTTPWRFWNDRCYRSFKALHPEVPFVREGTHHNALDDAISQAKHLCQIFESIKGKKHK